MFSFISGYYGLELRRIHNIRYFISKKCLASKEKFMHVLFQKLPSHPNLIILE